MSKKPQDADLPTGWNPRAVRTREALRTALMELLERKPLEQVTIREIATEAKIGYATFFRHHADKESLLKDLAAHQINRLISLTLPMFYTVDSSATSRALCAYVWEHQKIWSVLLTGGAAGSVKQEFIQQARQLAAEQGNPESWLPGDMLVVFSVAGALELLAWWLEHNETISVEHMAEIVDKLVIAPSRAIQLSQRANAARPSLSRRIS